MPIPSRTAVVTGVSTGIGQATARLLGHRGFQVFGSVRRKADAAGLQDELGDAFVPLEFDVTDEAAVRAAADEVRAMTRGATLGGLVNNAGIAVGGPLTELPVAEFRKQLDVNLTGVLIAVQAFTPLLGMDGTLSGPRGRIVNMGSVGGRNAFPFMGPYHASKFGLEGLTDSLRRELMLFGIDAILVAPGSINTPIWDKAESEGGGLYQQTPWAAVWRNFVKGAKDIGDSGIAPERVAETVWTALSEKRPKTYYRVTGEELQFQLLNRLPSRWVDRIVGDRLGLTSRDR